MKSKYIATVASVLLGLTTSAFAVEWGIAREEKIAAAQSVSDPGIDVETRRDIGEPLLRTGVRAIKHTTSWVITPTESGTGTFGFTAMFRQVRAVAGASSTMLFHSHMKSPMYCVDSQGTPVTTNPAQMAGCFVDTDKDGRFDAVTFPGYGIDKSLGSPIPYKTEAQTSETEVEHKDSYFTEVLYQGISKGEIKISFREFKGGVARPAFTQDVTYELEADGTAIIGFRGLRIQVLKASREGITYVVKQLSTNRSL